MKKVTVFLDLEGWWDRKYRSVFDVEENTDRILDLLNKYKVKAVFNVLGVVVQKYPGLIKKIHSQGHEIASKGYKHENFSQLSYEELNKVLEKTEKSINKVIKQKPAGIRSPWLINDKQIYSCFKKRGYKWASNSHLLLKESFDKPIKHEFIDDLGRLFMSLKFLTWKNYPYYINGLLEIPLLSSYERDLLDMVCVTQETPDNWLDYSFQSLKKQYLKSNHYFNLNFHCWAIGTGNRLILLEKIIKFIIQKEGKFVLAHDLVK